MEEKNLRPDYKQLVEECRDLFARLSEKNRLLSEEWNDFSLRVDLHTDPTSRRDDHLRFPLGPAGLPHAREFGESLLTLHERFIEACRDLIQIRMENETLRKEKVSHQAELARFSEQVILQGKDREEWARERLHFEKELAASREYLQEVANNLRLFESQVGERKREIEDLRLQLDRVTAERDTNDHERVLLRNRVHDLERVNKSLTERNQSFEPKYDHLRQQLTSQEGQLAKAEAEKSSFEKESQNLRARLQFLETELESLRQPLKEPGPSPAVTHLTESFPVVHPDSLNEHLQRAELIPSTPAPPQIEVEGRPTEEKRESLLQPAGQPPASESSLETIDRILEGSLPLTDAELLMAEVSQPAPIPPPVREEMIPAPPVDLSELLAEVNQELSPPVVMPSVDKQEGLKPIGNESEPGELLDIREILAEEPSGQPPTETNRLPETDRSSVEVLPDTPGLSEIVSKGEVLNLENQDPDQTHYPLFTPVSQTPDPVVSESVSAADILEQAILREEEDHDQDSHPFPSDTQEAESRQSLPSDLGFAPETFEQPVAPISQPPEPEGTTWEDEGISNILARVLDNQTSSPEGAPPRDLTNHPSAEMPPDVNSSPLEKGLADEVLAPSQSIVDFPYPEITAARMDHFMGKRVLLVGGDERFQSDYDHLFAMVHAKLDYYPSILQLEKKGLRRYLQECDVIVIFGRAVNEPGFIRLRQTAEEYAKPVIEHHSSGLVSLYHRLQRAAPEVQ